MKKNRANKEGRKRALEILEKWIKELEGGKEQCPKIEINFTEEE